MRINKWISRLVLLPVSKIYGLATFVRNKMFDFGILRQREFDVPVVVVGNIAAGGTGKTPHVEYLIDTLRHNYHIGVLSRGYKRRTKGFVMATQRSTPLDIGDEPYQIFHKFSSSIVVAVCENRVEGITELLRIDPKINLVILDDAFQHRYVKPTVSIVLTEFNRPVFEDHLLPYGNLREGRGALRRADMVIVTKCSESTKALDYTIFKAHLNLFPYQKLYFSRFLYGALKPVFPDQAEGVPPSLEWLTEDDMILTVAGIGNPRPFVRYVKHFRPKVRVNIFPDHHFFSKKDIELIEKRFMTMPGRSRFIVTTEKDAVRLANNPYFPHELKAITFYLPIKVDFMRQESDSFETAIRKLIRDKQSQTPGV
ncbi:MAG: tetraacyldisaccharide 4'-kinase [Bacteroides sp.]|nr:tetraacyldisaccharide 4'-kinase [Bacteroides sp.]MCM1456352.1 tetraacyldisaccharide 4'-kinase [Lachnoclostridium sp.]